ncbi:hypothetical protein JX266_011443 [Neoarthrinium moseri]|nr:hypothetical protein JX266_011443 [Neoarthrinium moseri]
MSFGFSVGDFLAIIELSMRVRKEFADAPAQFHAVSAEIRSLSIVLQDVDAFLSQQSINGSQLEALKEVASSCRTVLGDLAKLLSRYMSLNVQGQGVKRKVIRAWKRLEWEPRDVYELRSRITSNIVLLNSLVHGISRDNTVYLVHVQEKREHQEILDWLTSVDYAAQQSDFLGRRQAGTGQWFLKSPQYEAWASNRGQSLFCPGIPGAGKTILASVAVNDLASQLSSDLSFGLCYIFCNFRQNSEQSFGNIMLSLLRQLSQYTHSLTQAVINLYGRHQGKHTKPSTSEICDAVERVILTKSRTFIVIDALDELQISDGSRSKLISALFNLRDKFSANILVTSRFTPDISQSFEGSPSLEISASYADILTYLDEQIPYLSVVISGNPALCNDVKHCIAESVSGMFLLAQLYLDSLRGKRSPKAVRAALGSISNNIPGNDAIHVAYRDAMDRINRQMRDQTDLAMEVLLWITCARRPLSVIELQQALAVELNEAAFDEENLTNIQEIVSVCCGLVTVDAESNIVRLVHYTAQQFFEQTQKEWFPAADEHITKVCITYLSYKVFEEGPCKSRQELKNRLSSYPLYEYATAFWGFHAKMANMVIEFLNFLQNEPRLESATQALSIMLIRSGPPTAHDTGLKVRTATGLHMAAHFGFEEAVSRLLELYNPDTRDSDGYTPLHWATAVSRQTVVRILIEKGASLEVKGLHGAQPLSIAALNEDYDLAHFFLEKGANVNAADDDGVTALMYAAKYGSADVVRLLIQRGAHVNATNDRGQTALALRTTSDKILTALLENGADANIASVRGTTPLMNAARDGAISSVRQLIEYRADVHAKTDEGFTALAYAAEFGRLDTVSLLLECNADPNSQDNMGRPPVFYAVVGGHEGTAALLLCCPNVDVTIKDVYGNTVLSVAARLGCVKTVVTLLSLLDIEPNPRDQFGRTPLWWARYQGHDRIVTLLTAASPSANDEHGSVAIAVYPRSHSQGYLLYCDACLLPIPEEESYYRCRLCNGGNFDICVSCRDLGADCLNSLHSLVATTKRYE